MKIKFHGAVGTVTGSCYELYEPAQDVRFLVDCGMKQGERDAETWNRREFPFDPKSLDFVVLTHAHLDHCGLLPLLYKRGFRGQVFCTAETASLATIILKDSSKYCGLYSPEDIAQIRWRSPQGQVFGKYHKGKGDIYFRYLRSAHILGAVSVEFWWGTPDHNRKILFSGDLGNNREGEEFQPLMRHAICPDPIRSTNAYVVMESTYGARDMSATSRSFETRQQNLKAHIIKTVFEKEGTLIIPCFAVHRTQAVLFDLHYLFARHPELAGTPVFFDANLASTVNEIYAGGLAAKEDDGARKKQFMWLNQRLFEWMDLNPDEQGDRDILVFLLQTMLVEEAMLPRGLSEHRSEVVRRWRKIWEPAVADFEMPARLGRPSIVVTGGGMCAGGPVASYLQKLAHHPRHTFLLTGYCEPGSNGGKLMNLSQKSLGERALLRDELRWERGPAVRCADVKADVHRMSGYSGHADRKSLIDWFFPEQQGQAEPLAPTVFLTHGNDAARRELRKSLLLHAGRIEDENGFHSTGLQVESPMPTDGWYDLNRGEWVASSNGLKAPVINVRSIPPLGPKVTNFA